MGQNKSDSAPDSFLDLSCKLTGYDNLNPQLAAEYYQALLQVPEAALGSLLDEYELKIMDQLPALKNGLIKSLLWSNPVYKETCIYTINLWYISALSINGVTIYAGSATAYIEALFPKTAQAHQLAVSGGYQGYWHYPPEN